MTSVPQPLQLSPLDLNRQGQISHYNIDIFILLIFFFIFVYLGGGSVIWGQLEETGNGFLRNFVKWKRKFVIWGCLVCGKVLVFRLDLRWVSSVLYWVFVDLELGFLLVLLLAISSSSISNPPMLRSLFFSISLNVFYVCMDMYTERYLYWFVLYYQMVTFIGWSYSFFFVFVFDALLGWWESNESRKKRSGYMV